MSDKHSVLIFLSVVLIIGYLIFLKKEHIKRRKGKTPLKAKVKKYAFETTEVRRNHRHSEWSIYVEVTRKEFTTFIKLNYSTLIYFKPFRKGQVIKVFWHGTELYYWNSYEKGVFKLLPPFN